MFVIALLFAGNAQAKANDNYSPPNSEITYQQFYNDLSPYGNWINDPQYGYVWSPRESEFHPYRSNGNWAHTRFGWTWVSGYSWGWAPFHYGRWIMDPYYGWLWIPGYEWAPAWVDWRSGGDYYGWAPMGPFGFNVSVNFWNFVPRRYIYSRRMNNYYVNPTKNVTIINNTTIINNYGNGNNSNTGPRRTYNTGPSVREVEDATRAKVRTLDVVQSSKPGVSSLGTSSIRMYKPEVEKSDNSSATIRPVKAIELSDVQKRDVLDGRKGSLEKSDLRPATLGSTRNVNADNKSLNETPERVDANTFQDNGIKNSSVDRRQLNTVRPELNNTVNPSNRPSRELNATPERPSRSRVINQVTQDQPVANSQMEKQDMPVQDRSIPRVRQTPSRGNEIFSRDVPEARNEAREQASSRQPAQTREAPVRRVAPVREVPLRQERVRSVPVRENNSGKNSDSPRRVRKD